MKNIFNPPQNCHRVVTADHAAFIIDGKAYFRALHESFRRARRCIFVVGWDLRSDLRLVRDNGRGEGLGEYLDRLVSANDRLHVYLLSWDFSMIYVLEREFFPRYRLEWRTHKRVQFFLDAHHPVGASQHQKMVVVDDAVAFVGGLDLSKWRWDTPAHRPGDPHRVDPDGKAYPPFHDVQMIVSGEAATAVAGLARDRWVRATGRQPVAVEAGDEGTGIPWPDSTTPDFSPIRVAVARTLPVYRKQEAVGEVRQLYLDSIAAAERFVYIENQYFSSHEVGRALARRLQDAEGPEVVIVMPEKSTGWLEHNTMDILRARIFRDLRQADRYDRLRAYFPRVAREPLRSVMVHAKVMVIDDEFARVGSSNLSNRSMGLDSECDLAVAASDEKERSVIADFKNRLLAEHLGASVEDVEAALGRNGSFIAAIESLGGGERSLVPLVCDVPPEIDRWVPESEVLDPEKPVAPDELFDHFIRPTHQPFVYRHLMKVLALLAAVIALAAIWRWTPASEWFDLQSAKAAGEWIRGQPFTPIVVPAAYVLGGLVAFPVTLMIVATVMVFGPWLGLFYAMLGAESSALFLFAAGRILGRESVRRLSGGLVNRLGRRLAESGLTAVITFRIVPVAPFSVINLIAGASEIRLRDYALGTLIGMVPGMVSIAFLSDRIAESFQEPSPGSFAALGGAVLLVAVGLVWLRRWVKRKRAQRSGKAEG